VRYTAALARSESTTGEQPVPMGEIVKRAAVLRIGRFRSIGQTLPTGGAGSRRGAGQSAPLCGVFLRDLSAGTVRIKMCFSLFGRGGELGDAASMIRSMMVVCCLVAVLIGAVAGCTPPPGKGVPPSTTTKK